MKLNLTNHAKQRMSQRKINKNEIENVMSNGKLILDKSNPISKIKKLNDVTVVFNWDDSIKTVIKDEKYNMRKNANELADEFKSFYEQAKITWDNGDKSLAKELSVKGKKIYEECRKLTDKLKFKNY